MMLHHHHHLHAHAPTATTKHQVEKSDTKNPSRGSRKSAREGLWESDFSTWFLAVLPSSVVANIFPRAQMQAESESEAPPG